jgi:hypothetical protein
MQAGWRGLRQVTTIGERYLGSRHQDGSAGDVNYGAIGQGYAAYRQPEPEIAGFLGRALGNARCVLNVGAGAGSYEPLDREVTAVEPSASMRRQRPAHLPAAIEGVAEKLPFADQSFDASMATFSVHPMERSCRRAIRNAAGDARARCDPDLRSAAASQVVARRICPGDDFSRDSKVPLDLDHRRGLGRSRYRFGSYSAGM